MELETLAKFVFSGGIALFLIERLIKFVGNVKFKKRLTKEIAWEFFENEYCAIFIIRDFQNLQKDRCGYLDRHIFKTQAIDSVLSSGYFVNLDFDLSQLIFEFAQRFKIVQYELSQFLTLNDDQKLLPANLELLKKGESVSKLLLNDFNNKIRKLKKKYYPKWRKDKMKLFEKKYKIKINEKEKKEFIKKIKEELE